MNSGFDHDGIIDYPICPNSTATTSPWKTSREDNSPLLEMNDGYATFTSRESGASDRVAKMFLPTVEVRSGVMLAFKFKTTGGSFYIDFGHGIRFFTGSGGANWSVGGGSYVSPLRPDGKWYSVILHLTRSSIACMEDRGLGFVYKNSGVGDWFTPTFSVSKAAAGSEGSVSIGEVHVISDMVDDRTNSPWCYGFRDGELPDSESMSFRIVEGGPQRSVVDNCLRLSATPLRKENSWTYVDIGRAPSGVSVYTYKVRVNSAEGNESKLTFPGGYILHIHATSAGKLVEWRKWNQDFTTIGSSNIVVGSKEFRTVKIITSGEKYFLFEDENFIAEMAYQPESPTFSVQHLNPATNFSADFAHVRAFPSVKSHSALARCLGPHLMGYFTLRQTLTCGMGEMVLRAENGTPSYVEGPQSPVASFNGSGCYLALPQMRPATSRSYTLSALTKVRAFPPSGKTTAIAGGMLLNSSGHIVFEYIYGGKEGIVKKRITSRNLIALNEWISVVVSFSHMKKRVAIYIDGKLDSMTYLEPSECTEFAVVPCVGHIGGYKESFSDPVTVLNGDVSDVIFLSCSVDQPAVNLLAMKPEPLQGQMLGLGPIAIGAFALITSILGALVQTASQRRLYRPQLPQVTIREPRLTVEEIVSRIVSKVGKPAAGSCSRQDIGVADYDVISLDIGGEGFWPKDGRSGTIPAGIEGYINVNANMGDDSEPKAWSHDRGVIENLVYLRRWSGKPKLPFGDKFADDIMMQGAPLMPYMVDEIARVIRPNGKIYLWIASDFDPEVARLASLLNCNVEYPVDKSRFKENGGFVLKFIDVSKKNKTEL